MDIRHICKGDGCCLTQTDDCNTYGKDSTVTCEYNCTPKLCGNYLVCGTIAPQWYLGIRSRNRCLSCDYMFRKQLVIVENVECPLCLETKQGVLQLNCTHSTCVDCFKRCMYGEASEECPSFPYPNDIEEKYNKELHDTADLDNTDEFDAKWKREYPLVAQWEVDCEQWHDDKDQKYASERNLRVCPICRQ